MKNSVKLFQTLTLIVALVLTITSCNEENTPDGPILIAPDDSSVEGAQTLDLSFAFNAPEGLASATVTATGGTVSDPNITPGETTGLIAVTFTAQAAIGSATVEMTITDARGNSATQIAAIAITDNAIITITENISEDVTWETGKTYLLANKIAVLDGATLTIEAGVVVKAFPGEAANAVALLVAQGGKLNANGTANLPIIFTSIADNITPALVAAGTVASPNLDPQQTSLWGGLVILGKAPISAKGGAESVQIEGIPPSDTNGLYGGNVADDNSGSIRYISIRHGGADIGEGNEINGLTLGGVGSGTTIEYVEVIGNKDDGIEYFGGAVNTNNTVVWNAGDDSYDSDQAWDGTANNFIAILGPQSDHGMEIDGPESATNPGGVNKFTNGTIVGNAETADGEYADLRSDAKVNITNVLFMNGKASSDFELDNNGVATNYVNQLINLSGLEFIESHLPEGDRRTIDQIVIEKTGDDEDKLDVFTTRPLDASVKVVETATVGATTAEFANWSWASAAGKLDF